MFGKKILADMETLKQASKRYMLALNLKEQDINILIWNLKFIFPIKYC